MDDLVRKAIARWPKVPAVYGWLRLQRRGRWMLVDRGAPDFDETRDAAGSEIGNRQIVEFIDRNYQCDGEGAWYFQNGPQRAYVDLEVAPLVLRVLGSGPGARLVAHTGAPVASAHAAWRTRDDALVLATDLGHGAIHDLDLAALEIEPGAGEALSLVVLGRRLAIREEDASFAAAFVRRPRQRPGRS
ncbi:MAG: DUF2946 family protein [Burkholderiaceae bacterium]|nr:DUF2946 family protein [Burkholderiaceae bacterium]